MSDRPPLPLPPSQKSGCGTAVLVLFGLILLLPGLCTIIVSNGHLSQFSPVTEITFAIGFVGLIVIALGLRRL
jgi:hypothetical protein